MKRYKIKKLESFGNLLPRVSQNEPMKNHRRKNMVTDVACDLGSLCFARIPPQGPARGPGFEEEGIISKVRLLSSITRIVPAIIQACLKFHSIIICSWGLGQAGVQAVTKRIQCHVGSLCLQTG